MSISFSLLLLPLLVPRKSFRFMNEGGRTRIPTTSTFIEVRVSNIHGTGVFASQDIPTSTKIIEYVGERVHKDSLANLPSEARYYTHRLDDNYFVDGSSLYNTAR